MVGDHLSDGPTHVPYCSPYQQRAKPKRSDLTVMNSPKRSSPTMRIAFLGGSWMPGRYSGRPRSSICSLSLTLSIPQTTILIGPLRIFGCCTRVFQSRCPPRSPPNPLQSLIKFAKLLKGDREEVNAKYDRDAAVHVAATCVTCADLPQLLSERLGEADQD